MLNPILLRIQSDFGGQKVMAFEICGDSTLRYQGRLFVYNVDSLRERIFPEAHESRYVVYPSSMKMYHDLKEIHWWDNMKRYVANFMAKCIVCQQVKVEHMRPTRLYREIKLSEWKWEIINMDFVTTLPRSRN